MSVKHVGNRTLTENARTSSFQPPESQAAVATP
jgi:hypothetical protein